MEPKEVTVDQSKAAWAKLDKEVYLIRFMLHFVFCCFLSCLFAWAYGVFILDVSLGSWQSKAERSGRD